MKIDVDTVFISIFAVIYKVKTLYTNIKTE